MSKSIDKPISFPRKDSGIELEDKYEQTGFFDLPPEVRTLIYELVFDPIESRTAAFSHPGQADSLNENYFAADILAPLLTSRQFHADANLLAFSCTTFVVRNPFTSKNVSGRLASRLRESQIRSIRSIAFIAEAEHFRQMRNWKGHAFGVPQLQLDELSILLYRSSYWHYLQDFNAIVISLLRSLGGVKKITYIKNESKIKPHFHTWVNRLVGGILATDRFERFGTGGVGWTHEPNVEKTWWSWEFDHVAQTASLFAQEAKSKDLSAEEYERYMEPLREKLLESVKVEEYDPDPRSRNGFV